MLMNILHIMKRLTPSEIQEKFNARSATALSDDDPQIGEFIQHLSHAVADLKEQGVDIDLELTGWCGSYGFKLPGQATTVIFSGTLRVGVAHHHVTMVSKKKTFEGEKPCRDLHISYYNALQGELDNRTWSFDFMNDDNALVDLQEHILMLAARNKVIHDNDTRGVFVKTSSPITSKTTSKTKIIQR